MCQNSDLHPVHHKETKTEREREREREREGGREMDTHTHRERERARVRRDMPWPMLLCDGIPLNGNKKVAKD